MVLLEQVAAVAAAGDRVALLVAVLKALMAEQVERMAVAAERLTAVMAEQAAAVPYVLFGPEPQDNFHLHIPAICQILLPMCLLWLVVAVAVV
jgi:hypothetical protein